MSSPTQSRPAPGPTRPGRDDQPAHVAARPAGHRRRGRHERLRRRAGPPAGRSATSRSRSTPGPRPRRCRRRSRRSPGVTVHHVHAGPFEGLTKARAARPAVRRSPARCCGPRPATTRAGTTSCTPTTGSPARSARWSATAGASRWCTRCTPWPRSRTPSLAERRHPRARRPGDRRGAGRRGRRHADRQHRHRGQAADRAVRRRPGPRRGGAPRASTSSVFRPAPRRRARRLGLPARRRRC